MFNLLSGILSMGSGRNDRSLVRGRSARHPFSLARLLGRYDAATTTIDNVRHWAVADGLSASAANSPEVRRTLRNRSRYEIANNSYARGISLTLANDCVGTGPRLQMLTTDAFANRFVEQEFYAWTDATGLAEKLRTMRIARVSDGETFGLLPADMFSGDLDSLLSEIGDFLSSPDWQRTTGEGHGSLTYYVFTCPACKVMRYNEDCD